jgi:hypothetical protein
MKTHTLSEIVVSKWGKRQKNSSHRNVGAIPVFTTLSADELKFRTSLVFSQLINDRLFRYNQ